MSIPPTTPTTSIAVPALAPRAVGGFVTSNGSNASSPPAPSMISNAIDAVTNSTRSTPPPARDSSMRAASSPAEPARWFESEWPLKTQSTSKAVSAGSTALT